MSFVVVLGFFVLFYFDLVWLFGWYGLVWFFETRFFVYPWLSVTLSQSVEKAGLELTERTTSAS